MLASLREPLIRAPESYAADALHVRPFCLFWMNLMLSGGAGAKGRTGSWNPVNIRQERSRPAGLRVKVKQLMDSARGFLHHNLRPI